MPSQANQPLPEGYQLQNYRIAKVLSAGGFSIVYLAHDENDQPVAIKEYLPSPLALRHEGDVLPSIADENLATFRYGMKCFFEEGRSLAHLSHPNVVRVLNFFRANETVYLVMRYERGRTLQEHIQARRGAIKENFIRHMFTLLLNGLREVHSNKLLHLDIKPANIYIRNDGTPGADRLRRRAPDADRGGPQAEPDVHAGIRVRPSSTRTASCSAPGATATRSARACSPASPAPRRRPRTTASRRTATSRRRNSVERQVLATQLLETIDWCLAARPPEAPAERVRAAEGAAAREGSRGAERKRSLRDNLRGSLLKLARR